MHTTLKSKKRYRTLVFIIFLSCITMLHLWFSYIAFHYSYVGVEVENVEKEVWIISRLDPEGLGSESGLIVGDQILEINGQFTGEHSTVANAQIIEQADRFLINRDGTITELITSNEGSGITSQFFTPFILEIICFLLAGYLYLSNHQYRSAKLLSLVFLVIGLAFLSTGASARGDFIAKIIVSNTVMLLPIVFMHFLLIFIHEKSGAELKQKWINNLYYFFCVLILVEVLLFILAPYYQYIRIVRLMTLIILFIGILGIMTHLLLIHRRQINVNPALSSILSFIWVSLFISFMPFIILSTVPRLFYGQPWIDYSYTSSFIMFFPVSFLYMIFARQLFNVEKLLKHILYITAMALVPTLLILLCIIVLGISTFNTFQLTVIVASTFISCALAILIMDSFNLKLEVMFFPEKRRLRMGMNNIIKKLHSITRFSDIEETILAKIVETLDVSGAAVECEDQKNNQMVISHGIIDHAELCSLPELSEHKEYSVFPINLTGRNPSNLFLTNKVNNIPLNREELDWIRIIVAYLSNVLENLYLIHGLSTKLEELTNGLYDNQLDELEWLKKLLFQIQERERERIAADLHDTVMQDIYFIKQKFELLKLNPMNREIHNDLTDHLSSINISLRETCYNIYPHLLSDVGLMDAIRELIRLERSESIQVEIRFDNETEIEQIDILVKIHLFRIVQELLTNAKKHSQANSVKLLFYVNSYGMHVEYMDNGVGLENKQDTNSNTVSDRLGLIQIKNRIIALQGNINIQTNGEGLKIEILIPILKETA